MKKQMKLTAPSKTKTYIRVRKEIKEWIEQNSILVIANSRWYVGITNDANRRKKEHEIKNNRKCKYWKMWNMKSVRLSLALETSLHKQGLLDKDTKGGYNKKTSKYIYVYKKFPTIVD